MIPPRLSVVVCSLNRSGLLQDTLSSFDRSIRTAPPDFACELVVVDNGSTDDTAAVVAEAARHSAVPLHYVQEPRRGLSVARNTGIRAAAYEIVGFIDDDVFVQPGWANAIARAFADCRDAGCVGGQTIPLFEAGRPAWMNEDLLSFYGSTGSGSARREMRYPEHPFGVNMAIRKAVFDAIGEFNPALGRVSRNLLSNEESDLFRRASAAGFRILYEPDAILEHRIPAERTRERWVLARAYWQGISDVVMAQLEGVPPDRADRMRRGLAELGGLARGVRGGFLSPRRIRWHVHGLPFSAKVHYAYRLGKGRQLVLSAFAGRRHAPTGVPAGPLAAPTEDHAR